MSIVVIWVINHFSLKWNVILVEYFGDSKSIPHQPMRSHDRKYPRTPGKDKEDRMACVAAKWVPMNLSHPTH